MMRALALDLIREAEGCTLTAKKDSQGFEIGWGHHTPNVFVGLTWTQDQADAQLLIDADNAAADAQYVVGASCWATLNEARQAALIDMAYELGRHRLLGFIDMTRAVQTGDWQKAHDEALNSELATQVPTRSQRDAAILLSGEIA